MNDPERLDLSALDPMRDPAHWGAVVDATLQRVDRVLARRVEGPLHLIADWARPVLIAAAATIAILVPVELALEAREERSEQVERLVALSNEWDHGEPPPTASDFVRALVEEVRP